MSVAYKKNGIKIPITSAIMGGSSGTSNYDNLINKPFWATNNSQWIDLEKQSTSEEETIFLPPSDYIFDVNKESYKVKIDGEEYIVNKISSPISGIAFYYSEEDDVFIAYYKEMNQFASGFGNPFGGSTPIFANSLSILDENYSYTIDSKYVDFFNGLENKDYDTLINKPLTYNITNKKYYNTKFSGIFDDADSDVTTIFSKINSGDYSKITLKFGNKKELVLDWSNNTHFYGIYRTEPYFEPFFMVRFDTSFYFIHVIQDTIDEYLPNGEILTISTDDGDISTIVPVNANCFETPFVTYYHGNFNPNLDKQLIEIDGIQYESNSKVGTTNCYWDFPINSVFCYRLYCNCDATDISTNEIKLNLVTQDSDVTSIDTFKFYGFTAYGARYWYNYKIPMELPETLETFTSSPYYIVDISGTTNIDTTSENIKINIDGEKYTMSNIDGDVDLVGYRCLSSDYDNLYLLVYDTEESKWYFTSYNYDEEEFSPIKDFYFFDESVTIDDRYKSVFTTEETVRNIVSNTAMTKSNPVGTGSFSMNRRSGWDIGNYSFAVGHETAATGEASHAEGYRTATYGSNSHAEGSYSDATGACAHSEGTQTSAEADYSHAEGYGSTSNGYGSHAEGYYSTTEGRFSHSEGSETIAGSDYQHVQGKYNIKDSEDVYAFIIGNGTDGANRSNALTVDWEGNLVCNNIPAPPTSDGTYILKCTVTDGVASYSWVSE